MPSHTQADTCPARQMRTVLSAGKDKVSKDRNPHQETEAALLRFCSSRVVLAVFDCCYAGLQMMTS